MNHKLLVIGGGASGMLAAISAANVEVDVAILEGTDRIGKKLLTTGNGRCNITNQFISPDRYHSQNPEFFNSVFSRFGLDDTIEFFQSLGLPLVTLENGKMYPMSLQASSVLDVLRMSLEEKNIPVYLNSKVTDIQPTKKGFNIYTKTNEVYKCEKVILACGGKSATKTGSDGSGFNLAKALGHSIIKPSPAIVQLKLSSKNLKALSGIKFNGFAEIFVNGHLKKKDFGEILFTDYGISGPPILQISRIASVELSNKQLVSLKINMLPDFTKSELENFLETHWAIFGFRSVHDSFIGVINKKIIPILLKESGINEIHQPCYNLSWKDKNNIYEHLQAWEFTVSDTNSFENAQITAGGINTLEVDPLTLQSKIVPNLYFAGEMLDVDGDCGGFNLQWAWSSGVVSGSTASK